MALSGPLVSDALAPIRDAIGDSIVDGNGDYRFSNEKIFRWLTIARAELVSAHPEAGYVDSVERPAFTAIAGSGEYIGVVDFWIGKLVELTVSKILVEESQDAANLVLSNDQLDKSGMKE